MREREALKKNPKGEWKKQIAQTHIVSVAVAGWLRSGRQELIPARAKQGLGAHQRVFINLSAKRN